MRKPDDAEQPQIPVCIWNQTEQHERRVYFLVIPGCPANHEDGLNHGKRKEGFWGWRLTAES